VEAFEVAIIGAGVHGASAAFHLASRSVRTIIFDRGGAAGGPTGRSSAICRAFYTNDFLARVARDSMEMFRHFRATPDWSDVGFRETGFLWLHPAGDENDLRKAVAHLNAVGTAVELLCGDDLGARFPVIDRGDIGWGAWEVHAGYADPYGTTVALLRHAQLLGAEIRLHCSVQSIEARPGGGAIVRTEDRREVSCSKLLIAAGPWSRSLANQVGANLPLHVERHFIATIKWPAAARMPYGHADVGQGYYCKPEGSEHYLLGGLHPELEVDPNHFSENISPLEAEELVEKVIRRVPALSGAFSAGGWASLYDVSPDWQPVIGESMTESSSMLEQVATDSSSDLRSDGTSPIS
jgi:sarcosine oxidase subunit beta